MSYRPDEIKRINSLDDLEKNNKEHDSKLANSLKAHGARILAGIMWVLGSAFTVYILRYLYLTAFSPDSSIANNMQDIIIKASGWLLFILSNFKILRKRNEKD